ncbi:MAG TPA: hypothetical protein VK041_03740, partial [Opitutales bacterium]|nr:hypothetical protein [Opitutales bacterium]
IILWMTSRVPLLFKIAFTAWLSLFCASFLYPNQSQYFEETEAHLDRGGIFYGYAEIDGDIMQIADNLTNLLLNSAATSPDIPIPPIPLSTIVQASGLDRLAAIGGSSVRIADHSFHNRTFLLFPDELHGLMQSIGVSNRPFQISEWAPEKSIFVFERELNPEALIDFSKNIAEIAASVAFPPAPAMLDGYLNTPLTPSERTALEILTRIGGRLSGVIEIDPTETMSLPEIGEMPRIDAFLRLENGGFLYPDIAKTLRSLEIFFTESNENGLRTITSLLGDEFGINLTFAANNRSGELFLATSPSFLNRVQSTDKPTLSENPQFQKAIERIPQSGVSFSFTSPAASQYISQLILAAIPENDPANDGVRDWLLQIFRIDEPLVSATSIEPNGILIASNWSHSHKQNIASLSFINPATFGLLAAIAIPTFNKVRETAQENQIKNNLRMLQFAAEQYFLETGETSVDTFELARPGSYIRELKSIAGETYPHRIHKNEPLRATLPDGREIVLD